MTAPDHRPRPDDHLVEPLMDGLQGADCGAERGAERAGPGLGILWAWAAGLLAAGCLVAVLAMLV